MRKNKNLKKLMIYAITALMALSAMSAVANAAFIELGNAASTSYESYVPFYGYYDYGWSAVIYLQSELGGAKALTGLTYDVYDAWTGAPYTIYDQKVWMKHTTDTNWVGNYAKPDPIADGYTLVYEGDITFTAIGFADYIPLDTMFSYNGIDNMIIYWENWDGDYISGQPRWQYPGSSYAPNRVKYRYADGSMPGDATSASYYFPNIRIHFQSDHDVGVTDIVTPEVVEGFGNVPVRVEVKNEGKFAETFPVNVKINAPPVVLLSEDFEGTYSIRPNPPLGWLVKDINLDGYFSGVYAYNMWGSYYSSSYAHSGTMSMRMDYGGSGGDNDWLFTPGVTLTAGVVYTLEWWDRMSSSSTSYSNNLEVFVGTAQHEAFMTTLLWSDSAMYHTSYRMDSTVFTVPVTGTYYIGFWRVNGYSYSNMFIDDVSLYVPGSTIYDQTVTMTNLGVGSVSEANLPDWVVGTAGTYEVVASTLLAGDENTFNDVMTQYTTVGLFDAQLDSIDIPTALMGPSPFNPEVTVSNPGNMYLSSLPVHATVADPSGGTGTVFEEEFEGTTSFFEFEGDIDIEFAPDAIWKVGEFVGAPGEIIWPEDEPQFGDPSDWTILNPDNNGAMWHQTSYRSSPNSPTHSMYAGDENTHQYLVNSQDVMISPKIHVGTAGGSFGFDIFNDVEPGYDYVYFGASADGISFSWFWFGPSSWATWMSASGVPIYPWNVDSNGDCYIAFMFLSDFIINYEGVYIDHVSVQGSPYLYDQTVYVSLPVSGSATVTFPPFEGIPGYHDYTINVCVEEPNDGVPTNDCDSLMFNNNAPVWNLRTGFGFGTIQAGIDDPGTIDGDTIMVNDGTFNEDVVIDKSITVSALTAPDCESGTTYLHGTVDIIANGVIFENFYVHPLEYFNHSQAAISIYSNDVIVRHNTVEIQGGTDGTIKGIYAYATPSEFTKNIEISDNCVHDVINCGGTGGGGGGGDFFFDFENNDGGWTISGTPDWEWTNTYNVGNYIYGTGSSDNPPSSAYSGTGLWGTKLYQTYTNAGAYAVLEKTFDFTGMTGVQIDWYSWEHVFGSFDYCELYANGALVWGPSWDYSAPSWKQRMADLSAYDGVSSVSLEFRMWATTVVAYSGWYIDDISITSSKTRYGDGLKDTILSEGFEGGVIPPSGWIHNQQNIYETWQIGGYSHTGSYSAVCYYDSYYSGIQDEWLISPSMDLTNYENTELDFWWTGSYYWSVSPYDNCDLSVYVSTSGSSGPWTMVWTEPTTSWSSWTYYNAIVDLSAYDGEGDVRLGFQYYGFDGAEFDIDDILVTADETGGGGGGAGYGGAVGIMDQGATWNVDILNNEVYDIHSSGWAYGIEVTPTALDPVTQQFSDSLDFYEDFTGVATGSLPAGWTRTHSNWGAYPYTLSGASSPCMRFSWTPSSTSQFKVITPEIDTTDFTTLTLDYIDYVNHYGGPYKLRVVGIAGGTEYTIYEWTNPTGWGSTPRSFTLTTAHGVGASDFQIGWIFDGNSFNINYWYFDNVHLYGSYDYFETVYPWPLNVNIDGNHLYRINLGDGYPCPDEPEYPGVMLTVNYATLPTGGPTPADASQVIAHNNWFDMDCFSNAIAILNMDLQHCLDATDNYYSQPDGPGTYPGNETIYDCMTAEPADGLGSTIVNFGPVHFDPWLGLNAVHNQPSIIYAETGVPILFDAGASWGNPGPITYYWKFDDGYYSMSQTVGHAYSSPGTYHGYLRIHNLGIPMFGVGPLYEWDYFTVVVSGGGAPLSANGGGGSLGEYEVSNGQYFMLFGTASGGSPPYTYQWDLGDGRVAYGPNPTVFYNLEDKDLPPTTEFTVTLTVMDSNYDTATDTVTVTVLGPDRLNVAMSLPDDANAGLPLKFTSKVTGGLAPYEYRWDFGDGSDINIASNPTHIYKHSGVYTVTLTVIDANDQTKIITKTITIEGQQGDSAEIKQVKGGFRVSATIAAGTSDCDWSISVDGNFVLSGGEGSGVITANTEKTVKLPLTLAFGKVQITVRADSVQQKYTAFALGPLFLNMQKA